MPMAPTHDVITLISAAALAPPLYLALSLTDPVLAIAGTALFISAHLVSGLLFSPDLDLDSAIDDRWGIFYWIWRPYMWVVPHRNFWSHSLVFAPLLRLCYFYVVLVGILIVCAVGLQSVGIAIPPYHRQLGRALLNAAQIYPREVRLLLLGFVTGSAAHSIADWLVTSGKHLLRRVGIRVRRNYANHDRYIPRRGRRSAWPSI